MTNTVLTIGEASRLAGVSEATVRSWCDRGTLPHQRTGAGNRQRLIDGATLQAFLQRRAEAAGRPQEPRS